MEKEIRRKNEKGITLVALIITVILMLILAGVAISAVVDADGLFAKIRNAANIYELESQNEKKTITNLMNYIDQYINEDLWKKEEKPNIKVQVNSSNEISVTVVSNLENVLEYEYYINNEKALKTDQSTYINSNLEPNTSYSIYVVAIDSNGKKYSSEVVTVKTKARVYLYKEGDEYRELTGGWVKGIYNSQYGQNVTLTKNESNMVLVVPNGSNHGGIATNKLLDLTEYDKLHIEYTGIFPANKCVGVSEEQYGFSFGTNAYTFERFKAISEASSKSVFELDISDISGEYYITSHFNGNLGVATFTVYEIWLE